MCQYVSTTKAVVDGWIHPFAASLASLSSSPVQPLTTHHSNNGRSRLAPHPGLALNVPCPFPVLACHISAMGPSVPIKYRTGLLPPSEIRSWSLLPLPGLDWHDRRDGPDVETAPTRRLRLGLSLGHGNIRTSAIIKQS